MKRETVEQNGNALSVLVLIPTYNEAENIEKLIRRIFGVAETLDDEIRILVVDDDSPDGTGKIVQKLTDELGEKRLILLSRSRKRGRGSAGIDGFRRCLTEGVDAVIEMDADFSHDPSYIPAFLGLLRFYDVVIGSRYVEGGAQLNREWFRELISIAANIVYSTILGTRFRDMSGGYKCYRRRALESLDFGGFFSTGYPIGMECLFRLYKKGFTFVEIPIVFPNRQYGASKYTLGTSVTAVAVALRLAWTLGGAGRWRRFLTGGRSGNRSS